MSNWPAFSAWITQYLDPEVSTTFQYHPPRIPRRLGATDGLFYTGDFLGFEWDKQRFERMAARFEIDQDGNHSYQPRIARIHERGTKRVVQQHYLDFETDFCAAIVTVLSLDDIASFCATDLIAEMLKTRVQLLVPGRRGARISAILFVRFELPQVLRRPTPPAGSVSIAHHSFRARKRVILVMEGSAGKYIYTSRHSYLSTSSHSTHTASPISKAKFCPEVTADSAWSPYQQRLRRQSSLPISSLRTSGLSVG
ncbi:hypothetical protein B0H14DRAFT_2595704 [Mycena olivaceomarginata]|nr:hypothetical protein B0H14DRAFT_2595704 [Mycena olivaceomarginata]